MRLVSGSALAIGQCDLVAASGPLFVLERYVKLAKAGLSLGTLRYLRTQVRQAKAVEIVCILIDIRCFT